MALLLALGAWVGCAPPGEEVAEEEEAGDLESELGGPVTATFQDGVSPSASYAGTTDANLQQSIPTTNAGNATSSQADMDYPTGTGKAISGVLRFELASIPRGSTVSAAKLTVNVTNATSGTGYTLYALGRAWSEGSVTWNQASAGVAWASGGARGAADRNPTPLGTLLPTATGAYTVTLNAAGIAVVQGWIDDPATNFGFAVDAGSNMDGVVFDASEAVTAANRPKLAVTYVPAAGTGSGLRGEYFSGKGFEKLVATRTDASVNFSWGSAAPLAGVPADDFSVRWTGQVQALYTQTYTFFTRSDDGVRLWVNGKPIVDNWTNHAATENSGTIALTAGAKVDIELEYYDATGGAVAQLSWSSANQPKEIVPRSQLFPAATGSVNTCAQQKQARAALVPGDYRPGPTTTGPLSCVSLTRHAGDLVVNTPNTVIEGVDLDGRLVLGNSATNVIVRHSILRGNVPSVSGGAVVDGGIGDWDRLGLTIEDSRIDLTGHESWFTNTLNGGNFTVRRTEIKRGVDGLGLTSVSGNTVIEANWIHDGYWTSWTDDTPEPKPGHSDNQTHSDGIQFHRGKNHVIRGNFIGGERGPTGGTGDDYRNAGMMISQAVDSSAANRLDNVLIEKNWLQGGAATINLAKSNNNDLSTVTIRNNRFLRSTGYYILKGAGTHPNLSNNVLDDTGAPVTVTSR